MLLWSSPNSSCHLWNHYPFFLQGFHQSSVSWCITPLHFFSSNIRYFCKKTSLKCKFWDFSVMGSKFTKLLMLFFKAQVSSFFNFASFFSVMIHNSSAFFGSDIIYFRQKQPIKMQIFRHVRACIKIHEILHVIFGTKSQFSFKLYITLQCYEK